MRVEQRAAAPAHHHDPARAVEQMAEHRALACARLLEDRVRGDDQRRREPVEEIGSHGAALAAEDSELVLEPNRVDIALVDRARSGFVAFRVVAHDRSGDILVKIASARVRQHPDVEPDMRRVPPQAVRDVGGEGGDPAFVRRVIADQRDPVRAQREAVRRIAGTRIVEGDLTVVHPLIQAAKAPSVPGFIEVCSQVHNGTGGDGGCGRAC